MVKFLKVKISVKKAGVGAEMEARNPNFGLLAVACKLINGTRVINIRSLKRLKRGPK